MEEHFLLLREPSPDLTALAQEALEEIGIENYVLLGDEALFVEATDEQIEAAYGREFFSGIYRKPIHALNQDELNSEQQEAISIWNHSRQFEVVERPDGTCVPVEKERPEEETEPPEEIDPENLAYGRFAPYLPETFKEMLFEHLGIDNEEEFLAGFPDTGDFDLSNREDFARCEQEMLDRFEDATVAYHATRMLLALDRPYLEVFRTLDPTIFPTWFHHHLTCRRMTGRIAIGLIVVDSSQSGGPQFSQSQRGQIAAKMLVARNWWRRSAPAGVSMPIVIPQVIRARLNLGQNTTGGIAFWRDPALSAIRPFGTSLGSTGSAGIAAYRALLKSRMKSDHEIVMMVSAFDANWHAVAHFADSFLFITNHGNWGGHGFGKIDRMIAHEMGHLFEAPDEYMGDGTPCTNCRSVHGCDHIPNGNCEECASPHQECIMSDNDWRLCEWTKAHVGWSDLFVEIRTSRRGNSGTDDRVVLDVGGGTFPLVNTGHNTFENGQTDGFALMTGLSLSAIRRIGLRKGRDGVAGGWLPAHIRIWHKGQLILDQGIAQWLYGNQLWWASTRFSNPGNIVNTIEITIHTEDIWWAGTDDNVSFVAAGRTWLLDNTDKNDFERNGTDTFKLDPGPTTFPENRMLGNTFVIRKSPDGVAGGWRLDAVTIQINGRQVYSRTGIGVWLSGGSLTFSDRIP